MFLGTYKTFFTGKNRIVLPRKFRKEIGSEGKFYIVKGLDGEIWGFDEVEWQKEAEKRISIPLFDPTGRVSRRKFFSQAEECTLDSQGRFIISEDLVKFAKITKEILLIGAGDHFEIWRPEKFEEIMKI